MVKQSFIFAVFLLSLLFSSQSIPTSTQETALIPSQRTLQGRQLLGSFVDQSRRLRIYMKKRSSAAAGAVATRTRSKTSAAIQSSQISSFHVGSVFVSSLFFLGFFIL